MDRERVNQLAASFREKDVWSLEECWALCYWANMEDEWERATAENFEAILYKAAEKLGVEII